MLILLFYLQQIGANLIDKSNLIQAIDCGSLNNLQSSYGFTYSWDDNFNEESEMADYNNLLEDKDHEILFTMDPGVYRTERHGKNFSYDIVMPTPGVYTLILKYAELWFNETGQRVFDVWIGQRLVIKDFDIVKEVGGPFMALDKFYQIEYTNSGEVFFEDELCQTTLAQEASSFKLQFLKGKADQPKIDGIILAKGLPEENGINQYNFLRYDWGKHLQEEKNKSIIRAQKESLEYWGDPPEPLVYFFFSLKFVGMLIIMAIFVWLIIEIDKLPITTTHQVESAKIDTKKSQGRPKGKKVN